MFWQIALEGVARWDLACSVCGVGRLAVWEGLLPDSKGSAWIQEGVTERKRN